MDARRAIGTDYRNAIQCKQRSAWPLTALHRSWDCTFNRALSFAALVFCSSVMRFSFNFLVCLAPTVVLVPAIGSTVASVRAAPPESLAVSKNHTIPNLALDLIWVEAGSFLMGSPADETS